MPTPSNSTDQSLAEVLKAEGNVFHQKGLYSEAYSKYSDAIKESEGNAILYANRAASALAMSWYLDAVKDAQEAVKIDPTYVKAWARLAKAYQELSEYKKSQEAWQSAFHHISRVENPSPAEKVLKTQIIDGLEFCKDIMKPETVSVQVLDALWPYLRYPTDHESVEVPKTDEALTRLPWLQAILIRDEKQGKREWRSSAWVVLKAFEIFQQGVETMKETKTITAGGFTSWDGSPNALKHLSTGILWDYRVFYIDSLDWNKKLDEQIAFELHVNNGWSWDSEYPADIRKEASQRLQESGWDSLRPAIETTMHCWIVQGFFMWKWARSVGSCVAYLSKVIAFLEWGRVEWKDVPTDERGEIFGDNMLRVIKRLYMMAMRESYLCDTAGPEAGAKLRKILKAVKSIEFDIKNIKAPKYRVGSSFDPGFPLSFWHYPWAEALSCLGFYCVQSGLRLMDTDKTAAKKYFLDGAEAYMKSSRTFPDDDIKHPTALTQALAAYWRGGAPLHITLPLCKRITSLIGDNAWKIWGLVADTESFKVPTGQAVAFAMVVDVALGEGKVTMDRVILPRWEEMDIPSLRMEGGAGPADMIIDKQFNIKEDDGTFHADEPDTESEDSPEWESGWMEESECQCHGHDEGDGDESDG